MILKQHATPTGVQIRRAYKSKDEAKKTVVVLGYSFDAITEQTIVIFAVVMEGLTCHMEQSKFIENFDIIEKKA